MSVVISVTLKISLFPGENLVTLPSANSMFHSQVLYEQQHIRAIVHMAQGKTSAAHINIGICIQIIIYYIFMPEHSKKNK